MTTVSTLPEPTRAPMSSLRRTALVAGLFYLATFIFSIPAAFGLYDNVLDNADFVLGAGNSTPVLWGAVFEIVTALTGIGTAIALYPVIKRHGVGGAVGFVASRTLEASMIFLGVVSLLGVCTLRQDLAGNTDHATLATTAHALVALKDWTFLLGPGFMASVNAMCLAPIMYRSKLVPRLIPTLGLIGAPLLFASSVGTVLGLHDQVSATATILVLPIFFWELSLGIWMTLKGFATVAPADEER
ncbi:hypothetical protein BH10ACT1_BH10ACT1_05330 [soil metagenome]